MDCLVCCEKFNKSTRLPIKCKTCEDDQDLYCQSCAKKYILDLNSDPACMICKVEWDQDFLNTNFPKTFIAKDLKEHREDYLFDKQMAMLPDTQEYAERVKTIENLEKQKQLIEKEQHRLSTELRRLQTTTRMLQNNITDLKYGNDEEKSTRKFTFKCPVEDCNGFLDDKYYCGICTNKICRHCFEIKDKDHECDEEKKETVTMLRKDTKPCPKCGEMIYKVDGCNQMWCTECHTAFDWASGRVETRNIHNPEYFRWMRENNEVIPRNPLDEPYDPCGNNIITLNNLLLKLRMFFVPEDTVNATRTFYGNRRVNIRNTTIIKDSEQTIKIIDMHRMYNHISAVVIPRYNNSLRINEDKLKDLRAYYILKKIDRNEFKRKVQMIHKKTRKENQINNVWNLASMQIFEYIREIYQMNFNYDDQEEYNKIYKDVEDILNKAENMRNYCNNSFIKIGKLYNMVNPAININWREVYNSKTYPARTL